MEDGAAVAWKFIEAARHVEPVASSKMGAAQFGSPKKIPWISAFDISIKLACGKLQQGPRRFQR